MPKEPNSRGWLWGLAALLAGLFIWGAVQVVVMPLETGEVYPAYSSLRADPLGAKALYESLEALPELSVSRLFKERPSLNAGDVLLVMGMNAGGWVEITQRTVTEYEKVLEHGGRMVFAFLPLTTAGSDHAPSAVLKDRWDIQLLYRKSTGRTLPPGIMPRRSALYFEPGAEWKVIETRENVAVAVERPLNGGSLVLVADSFPLSNEGLRESRNAPMIASMLGGARRVVFDESHFGVTDTGSVGVLLRKYGLEGGVAVLVLASALFMWRSASSFLPVRQQAREEAVSGRDAQEGLTSLLRRSVPEPDLLDTCYAEWSKTSPAARKKAAVESALASGKGRDVAEVYREVSLALKEKAFTENK